jgi:septal ring factor EnvC (AmiA/AmiB activator)
LLSAPLPAAEDPAAAPRQLQALQARIQKLQQSLETDRERKDQLQQSLRAAEREIGLAQRQLRRLQQQLADSERRLQRLEAAYAGELGQLARLREQLARDARAAYSVGRQERVKLLLNQEDPAAVGRMLTYYRYFAQARTTRIADVNQHLDELARLETASAAERRDLARLHGEQQQKTASLQEHQQQRQRVLARLQGDIRSKDTELQQLARDEKRLQELVRSLQDLLADIPRSTGAQRPFKERKGSMGWPVRGTLAARYGTQRALGDLTWRGVLIDAPAGSEVRAVAHGRVAFADWLRGFGLLMIVDHGDGYMTLYGHNQSLYKEAGEWVDTDEVIAAVGASGGQGEAGLYFEVRHNGRPVNPVSWIARR